MTKTELIARIAEETNTSKASVKRIYESLFDQMVEILKSHSLVKLFGFGNLQVVKKPKRKGRNPRTGETNTLTAPTVVRFKAAKALRDAVTRTK
ncbi:MAG: HU family DNA-binding protein [Deltaproteobacteria bacterium]|jgi:DNA-binding protein HU-beta|nr:HU family DNA-binding protein [Deltaproteobacteria bacterium]